MSRTLRWLAIISIIIVLAVAPACDSLATIHGDVSYTGGLFGGSFRIQNNDSFNWTGTKMTVNKVYIHQEDVPAGETRTIWAADFKKSDGTEFDPLSVQVKSFYIDCQTSNGKAHREWTWSN